MHNDKKTGEMHYIRSEYKYILTTLFIIAGVLSACHTPHTAVSADTDSIPTPKPILMCGLPADSFTIESSTVIRNDNLMLILLRAGLTRQQAYDATTSISEVFDVRNIRQGNSYMLFYSWVNDSTRQLTHFVYNLNPTTYLRCDIDRPIRALIEHREVKSVEKMAGASITSSLWNATAEQGLNPSIALDLSDIYAWTIDFFGIEKGDKFKVLYTEQFVDTVSIGIGEIKAAFFEHSGHKYYAFKYEQDSTFSYFDLEGNSLRKAFLKAPLKYSRISSRFSNGRYHPVLKIRRPHHGIDYAAPSGTPIMSIGDGKVIAKGWDSKGGGNYIKIRHNSVYTTVYMHMRGFARGITNGSIVRQGDVIGYVGATGLATGPHLDFRVYMNGKPIDPLRMEAPSAEPIDNDSFDEYMQYSDSIRSIIDNFNPTWNN